MPTKPTALPLWQAAISFAARTHKHQLRKDDLTPYAAHVMRVLMTVRDIFTCDDPEALAAAVLHDTIEDTTTDYDDLANHFGSTVADLVAALTKNMSLPEKLREAEYEQRLSQADWRARLIKLADVYDNFCDQASSTSVSRDKVIHKVQVAIALAHPDAPHHPETHRAITAVQRLIDSK